MPNKIYNIIFILFCFFLVFLSGLSFVSYRQQTDILSGYNSKSFDVSLDDVDGLNTFFPNIGVTTIPIRSAQAVYFFNAGQFKKSIELAQMGRKANPYIFFSEAIIAQAYLALQENDSALKYSKLAYMNLPYNIVHVDTYLTTLERFKDFSTMDSVFLETKDIKEPAIWNTYLSALAKHNVFNNNEHLIFANQAVDFFPDNSNFTTIKVLFENGAENVLLANQIVKTAEDFYSKGDFSKALESFKKAEDLMPYEYAYKENIAMSYLQLKDYEKAKKYLFKGINDLNPNNGKPEYLLGFLYVQLKKRDSACIYFRKSYKFNNQIGIKLFNQYCD